MAATKEMKDLCLKILPESCCIVPERRERINNRRRVRCKKSNGLS